MKKLTVLLISFLCSVYIFAQTGSTCADPMVISSLPYINNGLTTAGFGNDYNASDACGSQYMTGNDFVFTFQPTVNMNVKVKLTGTGYLTGIFIINDCPDAVGAVCIASKEEPGGNPVISSAPLVAGTTYYIVVSTRYITGATLSTAFNIEVSEVFSKDACAIMVFQPRTHCDFTVDEEVIMLIQNAGSDTIYTLNVGYSVNGLPEVIEPFSFIMPPGTENYHHFTQIPDLANPGIYNFSMFTVLPGEENTLNDTVKFPVSNNNFVSVYPYEENFESSDGGWKSEWIAQLRPGSSWEHGTPAATVINQAASGTQCWATNLTGNTLIPEQTYIISPCFDFSGLVNPVFEMDIWYETGTVDMVYVEYSIDSTYQYRFYNLLGTVGSGLNWYNVPLTAGRTGWRGNTGGWVHVRQTCDGLGGNPCVIFRIVFDGSFQTSSEGVAVDNIKISESPVNDLSVVEFISPVSSCGLSNEDVTVKVANMGLYDQINPEVRYSTDNGQNWQTGNINQTLAFQDTVTYTFTQQADMSVNGIHNFIVKTTLAGDQFPANDSVYSEIMNFPDISPPYSNNFESNNGYWLGGGLNSTWEYGTPSEATIDHAASGVNAWVTNLTGLHSEPEASTLTSPCFNLSGMFNPYIKLKVWYELTMPGYCQVQYKNFGGINWAALGSASDPDWYTAGYSWSGSSGTWLSMKHSLDGLPDNLQFRLNMQSPLASPGFAFDDFEICDGPVALFEQIFPTKNPSICLVSLSQNYDSLLWTTASGQSSNNNSDVCFTGYSSVSETDTVTLVAYNSCANDTFTLVLSPVDDIEEYFISQIKVYPNPFTEKITITSQVELNIWELSDIAGKVIYKGEFKDNLTEISTASLSKGSYLLKIYSKKGSVINKPVIKR